MALAQPWSCIPLWGGRAGLDFLGCGYCLIAGIVERHSRQPVCKFKSGSTDQKGRTGASGKGRSLWMKDNQVVMSGSNFNAYIVIRTLATAHRDIPRLLVKSAMDESSGPHSKYSQTHLGLHPCFQNQHCVTQVPIFIYIPRCISRMKIERLKRTLWDNDNPIISLISHSEKLTEKICRVWNLLYCFL